MDENTFWIKQIRNLSIGFLSFVAMLVADCQGTQRNIVAAIEAGAHPSLARCALITNVSCDSALIIALEKDDD